MEKGFVVWKIIKDVSWKLSVNSYLAVADFHGMDN